ncbi:hypothetical protein B0H14DRAFT_2560714 [Mycena olivaceomarginata]|nr:hypothetical protein B0H14DRAFT_2560714 [Mycena olivaceomarginata]
MTDKEIVSAVPNHTCLMQLKLKLTGREYVYDVGRGAWCRLIGHPHHNGTDDENEYGEQLVLEPGTIFFVGLIGLHYNRNTFPIPRSSAPRGIGRKFAVTEGVAFLSNLLGDWRLEIIPGPDREMSELAVSHFNGASTEETACRRAQ